MAIASIKEWFNHKDYQSGVELYVQYGTNSAIKTLLKIGPSSYNIKKLESELKALLEADDLQFIVSEAPPSSPSNDPLFNIKKTRKENYARVNYLHAQLTLVDEEKRKEYAFEILDLWDEIDTGWKMEDEYNSTGKAPNEKPIINIPNTPIELMKRLNNCKTNISKSKAKLKKAIESGDKNEIALKQSLLNHHLEIKAQIENKINSFNA